VKNIIWENRALEQISGLYNEYTSPRSVRMTSRTVGGARHIKTKRGAKNTQTAYRSHYRRLLVVDEGIILKCYGRYES
jgi:hypothetical protein